MTTDLRRRFLLDPGVCYLNHGAFGAAPGTVDPALADARRELAE